MSRRHFLASAPAVLAISRSAQAFAVEPAPQRIYLGTQGRGPGNGIFAAPWNPGTGEIGTLTLAAEVISPTFLALHRTGGGKGFLYCVSEVNGPDAKVSAYAMDPAGALTLLNRQPSGGGGPTHLSVSPDGRAVLVANYGGGSVSSFHVEADGSLSAAVSHFQFSGSGPYKGRQEAPHTHSAVTSPDGRFALVNDLGLDRIMIYALDSATATLTPANPPYWSGRPGSGPRHLAWNPNGKIVYGTNELDSTVEILAWTENPAGLKSLGHVSSLPVGFPPNTAFVGEIAASSDGRNVYAGNRVADDTVAVFDVDPGSGLLTQVQLAPSGGKNCRHITLDPSGRWMVISHQNSTDITVLERDTKTGRLSAPVHTYPASTPQCVIFA